MHNSINTGADIAGWKCLSCLKVPVDDTCYPHRTGQSINEVMCVPGCWDPSLPHATVRSKFLTPSNIHLKTVELLRQQRVEGGDPDPLLFLHCISPLFLVGVEGQKTPNTQNTWTVPYGGGRDTSPFCTLKFRQPPPPQWSQFVAFSQPIPVLSALRHSWDCPLNQAAYFKVSIYRKRRNQWSLSTIQTKQYFAGGYCNFQWIRDSLRVKIYKNIVFQQRK